MKNTVVVAVAAVAVADVAVAEAVVVVVAADAVSTRAVKTAVSIGLRRFGGGAERNVGRGVPLD